MLLGIDVGGTSIKAGVVTYEGEILATTSVRTEEMRTADQLRPVVDALVALAGDNPVEAVGLAVPGVVSAEGKLTMAPNVSLDLELLVRGLEEALPEARVIACNDANAAALGELWKGSGEGLKSLVFITLGTGLGAGIVVDGRVICGRSGMAGECGHINVVEKGGEPCGCGQSGCLERYASAPGLVKIYRAACAEAGVEPVELEHDGHALPIVLAAREGDATALAAISTMCGYLGRALAMIAVVLDPDAFIIGGGLSGGFDMLEAPLREAYEAYVIPGGRTTPILKAACGNEAGMLGAAYHAQTFLSDIR